MKTRCQTPRCKNDSRGRSFCSSCRCKQSRARNPLQYAYNNIKNRATQRHKPFTITLDDFAQFCHETRYLQGKGRHKDGYSVDCKINELGYVPGNLQVLPLGVNASKKTKALDYDWRTGEARVLDLTQVVTDDLPF